MVQSRNEERIQEDTRSVKTSLGSWSLEIQSLEREALNTYKKNTHTHTHLPNLSKNPDGDPFGKWLMKSGKKSLWAHGIHWGNSSGSTSKPPYLYLQWIISTLHHHLCRQLVMNFWKVLFQMLESETIKSLTDTSSLNFVATSTHPMQILQGTCTCSFPSPSNRSFVEFDLITGPWPESDFPQVMAHSSEDTSQKHLQAASIHRNPLRQEIESLRPTDFIANPWDAWKKFMARYRERSGSSKYNLLNQLWWQFAWVNSVLDFCEETSTNFFIENFGNVPEGVGQERERERERAHPSFVETDHLSTF